ncbi:MAG: hypothetical protein ACRDXB_06900, partial [Actinomycetes bacterium]
MSLERTIHRQAGVIAQRQAIELGMSARTVQRRVAGGAWRECCPSSTWCPAIAARTRHGCGPRGCGQAAH